ncbi:MAG: enoyl-CoA hydratase/isomerase family protein [Myxococcota bacterium]
MLDIVIAGPAKNALGTEILQSLRDQLAAAGDVPLLVRGEGDAFSAGLNLKEVIAADGAHLGRFLDLLHEVVIGLFRHPAPTVAAVTGHAIAGGGIVARACDHAVATTDPKTRIGLNETAIGLQFPPRLLDMVRSRLPRRFHYEVLLGGALMSPVDALRTGLVDELADDALSVARQRLEALAGHPRATYAANKAMLQGRTGLADPVAEQRFLDDVLPSWSSPELKARLQALLK